MICLFIYWVSFIITMLASSLETIPLSIREDMKKRQVVISMTKFAGGWRARYLSFHDAINCALCNHPIQAKKIWPCCPHEMPRQAIPKATHMSPSKPVLHSDKDVECHWKASSISIKLCLKEKKKKYLLHLLTSCHFQNYFWQLYSKLQWVWKTFSLQRLQSRRRQWLDKDQKKEKKKVIS